MSNESTMQNETNPMSFANRLRGTIIQLTRETEEGQEDWTPTINRLRDTLAIEIEREKSSNPPVENVTIDDDERPSYEDNRGEDDEFELGDVEDRQEETP
jgi:hypothetical protein